MIFIFGQDESKTVNKSLNNRNNDDTEKKTWSRSPNAFKIDTFTE